MNTTNKTRRRLEPSVRKQEILDAAFDLGESRGYKAITREAVAERAGCATGLVNRIFTNMKQLRKAAIRLAVQKALVQTGCSDGHLRLIGQALADRCTEALKAPQPLKDDAVKTLT